LYFPESKESSTPNYESATTATTSSNDDDNSSDDEKQQVFGNKMDVTISSGEITDKDLFLKLEVFNLRESSVPDYASATTATTSSKDDDYSFDDEKQPVFCNMTNISASSGEMTDKDLFLKLQEISNPESLDIIMTIPCEKFMNTVLSNLKKDMGRGLNILESVSSMKCKILQKEFSDNGLKGVITTVPKNIEDPKILNTFLTM
jgi:hypothetical protein